MSKGNKIELLDKYQSIFWYFDKSNLHTISDAVMVEFILNYGSLEAVKKLFTESRRKEINLPIGRQVLLSSG